MTKTHITTKIQELTIEELELKRKREAIQVMDEIRKKHKVRAGEKSSNEIIRYFRDTRYN